MNILELPLDALTEIVARTPLWDRARRLPFVNRTFLSLTRPLRVSSLKIDPKLPGFQIISKYYSELPDFPDFPREGESLEEASRLVAELLSHFFLSSVQTLELLSLPRVILIPLLNKFPKLKHVKLVSCEATSDLGLERFESLELVGLPSSLLAGSLPNLIALSITSTDIFSADIPYHNISTSRKLSKFGPNLRSLNLQGLLLDFSLFPSLTSLSLSPGKFEPSLEYLARKIGLKKLFELPKLLSLGFRSESSALSHLFVIESLQGLQSLEMNDKTLRDTAFYDRAWTSLTFTSSSFPNFGRISPANLVHLEHLSIENLEECAETGLLFSLFPTLSSLTALKLDAISFKNGHNRLIYSSFGTIRNLRKLSISLRDYSEEHHSGLVEDITPLIESLSTLRHLRKLKLRSWDLKISGTFYGHLKGLRFLEALSLVGHKSDLFAPVSIRGLAAIPNLRTLKVSHLLAIEGSTQLISATNTLHLFQPLLSLRKIYFLETRGSPIVRHPRTDALPQVDYIVLV